MPQARRFVQPPCLYLLYLILTNTKCELNPSILVQSRLSQHRPSSQHATASPVIPERELVIGRRAMRASPAIARLWPLGSADFGRFSGAKLDRLSLPVRVLMILLRTRVE
jgi:hypothetical protein